MTLVCPHCDASLTLQLVANTDQIPPKFEPAPDQNGAKFAASVDQTATKVAAFEGVIDSKALDLKTYNPSTGRKRYAYPDQDFLAWWAIYPRKVAKTAAWRKWQIAKREVSPATLIEACRKFAAANLGVEERFIVHPDRWLADGRWQDEATVVDNTPQETDWDAYRAEEDARIAALLAEEQA